MLPRNPPPLEPLQQSQRSPKRRLHNPRMNSPPKRRKPNAAFIPPPVLAPPPFFFSRQETHRRERSAPTFSGSAQNSSRGIESRVPTYLRPSVRPPDPGVPTQRVRSPKPRAGSNRENSTTLRRRPPKPKRDPFNYKDWTYSDGEYELPEDIDGEIIKVENQSTQKSWKDRLRKKPKIVDWGEKELALFPIIVRTRIRRELQEGNRYEDKDCTICLSVPKRKDAVFTICGHFFCFSCLERWLDIKKMCPVCRSPILPCSIVNVAHLVTAYSVSSSVRSRSADTIQVPPKPPQCKKCTAFLDHGSTCRVCGFSRNSGDSQTFALQKQILESFSPPRRKPKLRLIRRKGNTPLNVEGRRFLIRLPKKSPEQPQHLHGEEQEERLRPLSRKRFKIRIRPNR